MQNCDLVRFEKETPEHAPLDALRYPNKWFVGSRSGCSCSFRHLYSIELGFGEPVDWYPEEQEDIVATLTLVRIVKSLLSKGERVDCIDVWGQQEKVLLPSIEVDFGKISEAEFRFFENHRFEFTMTTS